MRKKLPGRAPTTFIVNRPLSVAEAALVVNVPEAEKYVAALREKFDPSARLGAPAHITLVYPFAEPGEIGASTLSALDAVISQAASFWFHLVALRRFMDTLYLAPEPAEPFVAMTQAIVDRFPDYRPYGGQFASVVPHLTVARGSRDDLGFAEESLTGTLAVGGIPAHCREVVLIENSSGRWQRMHTFCLTSIQNTDG